MSNELQRLSDNIKNLIEVTRTPVDTQYDAKSVNAQSGVAVAEAISEIPVLTSDTDATSVVVNNESNIAGSFGFNVNGGRTEVIDNITYGYYKIDMNLTSEENFNRAMEDFNNEMAELEANTELTDEEKLEQRRITLYLFKSDLSASMRYDATKIYIDSFVNTNGYYEIKTQNYVTYDDNNIFGEGSYIRLVNYPKIGAVNVDGYSFAAGINTKALGDASFTMGRNNISNGAYSATFGRDNTVAYNGAAFGRYNTVDGQMGTVFGQYNKITGHDGLAAGLLNEIQGTEDSVFGIKNIGTGEAQTVVGKANVPDDDAYFIVGNGTTDRTAGTDIERSNAFVVKKNGNAEVQGNLVVSGRNIFEKEAIVEIVDELPNIGEIDKLYVNENNEYVYISKPDSKKSEIWSGKLAEGFGSGSGTKDDPYIIETAEELATAVNCAILTINKKAVLDLFTHPAQTDRYEANYTSLPEGEYTITLTNNDATVEVSYGYASGSGDIFTIDSTNTEQTFDIYSNPVSDSHELVIYGDSADFAIKYNGSDVVEIKENVNITNAHFKLNNNIYLNDTTKTSWYNNTNKPWFTGSAQEYYVKDIDGNDTAETTTFLGHIDGNGYCVYGIWYPDDKTTNTSHLSSLIPTAQNGTTIKNLGICKSFIVSFQDDNNSGATRGQTAGFVANTVTGTTPSITFENCYIDENTYLYGGNSTGCAAGFLGYPKTNKDNPNILTNCYCLVPTSHYRGQAVKRNGLIGEAYNTYFTINNCYSITKPFEGSGASLPMGTITNVLSLGTANSVSMALYTKVSEEELKNAEQGEAFGKTSSYPKLKVFGYWEQISSATVDIETMHIWDGTIATEFAGGNGSEATPYIIETPEQFALMIENFGGGYYYKIVNDLYFNDATLDKSEWTNTHWYCKETATTEDTQSQPEYYYYNKAGTMGTFNGYIDGNGRSIIGLYHKDTTHYSVGLIPSMGNGYIKNLAIKNSELNANGILGGFIGRTARYGYLSTGIINIENCYINDDVIIKSSGNNGAGGIIGYTVLQELNIKNCYCLTTNITSNKSAAFVGESWSSPHTIQNCYSLLQPVIQDNVARKPTSCTNVYSTVADSKFGGIWTKVTEANMQGLNVLNTYMPGLVGEYVITSDYPKLKAFSTNIEIMLSDTYIIKQDKFAEIEYGEHGFPLYMNIHGDSGSTFNLTTTHVISFNTQDSIELNTTAKALYNNKEIATQEYVNSLITALRQELGL